MSLGFSNSIGETQWTQDREGKLEIRIPANLPDGVRSKDLRVSIKEATILCVRARNSNNSSSNDNSTILQWRLFGPVFGNSEAAEAEADEDVNTGEEEAEWVMEDQHLVIELRKKVTGAAWPCLLDLPLPDDEALLLPKAALEVMLARHFPSQDEGKLEAEVTEEDKKEKEEEGVSSTEAYLCHERRLLRQREEQIRKALEEKREQQCEIAKAIKQERESGEVSEAEKDKEMQEKEKDRNAEDLKVLETQINAMERMLELNQEIRTLRCAPTTMDTVIRVMQAGIDMARLSSGSLSEEETEDYDNEMEKELTPTQLLTLAFAGQDEIDELTRLHFLRLAAIRYHHPQSILILVSRYPTLPFGPYLLIRRALQLDGDVLPSPEANHELGNLLLKGSSHFLPLFPAAVYFFQRAAKMGYVASMLSLAKVWSEGPQEQSLLPSDTEKETLKNTSWYHSWVLKAADRGCGAAYFLLGSSYVNGEYGLTPSYAKAKHYLELAAKTGGEVPLLIQHSNILLKLEALKRKEDEGAHTEKEEEQPRKVEEKPVSTTKKTEPIATAPPTSSGSRNNTANQNALADFLSSSPSNNNSSNAGGLTFGRGGGQKSAAAAASAKRMKFWEAMGRRGVLVYAAFTLAFPLRVLLIGHVYDVLGRVVEGIPWLANPDYVPV